MRYSVVKMRIYNGRAITQTGDLCYLFALSHFAWKGRGETRRFLEWTVIAAKAVCEKEG
jgi:hypothetical protein